MEGEKIERWRQRRWKDGGREDGKMEGEKMETEMQKMDGNKMFLNQRAADACSSRLTLPDEWATIECCRGTILSNGPLKTLIYTQMAYLFQNSSYLPR